MHARNPYKTQIDFESLAESYAPLKPFLKKTAKEAVTIDFKEPDAQKRLTEALLARDFGLTLNLPKGRLCPPVRSTRLNYLLWVQDLLEETFRSLPRSREVIGLDIGTGASAIYPLLGCRLDASWHFLGTEIDSASYASAFQNVEANNLGTRIRVLKTAPSNPLLAPLFSEPDRRFAFTMCNPPFYGSATEVARSAESKALEPSAVCTGAEVEMITPGGEEAFVQRMVTESLEGTIGERCLWFTSMLGKLASVIAIVAALRAHKVDNYALAELVQGQTRRWVVAWSFTDTRVPDSLSRALPSTHHALFPPPNTLRQPLPSAQPLDLHTLHQLVLQVIGVLEGVIVEHIDARDMDNLDRPASDSEGSSLRVSAASNTWSRAARRRRDRPDTDASATTIMMVDIRAVRQHSSGASVRNGKKGDLGAAPRWALECTWRRGRERALFDGFWGYVCRKVGALLESRDA
ncbi:hypothetical protein DFH11DRAFT_1508325 [Phellopilus nigrolimitatus]|nr:hypothetical protein DFH11DRAFT_1508325 [Phellopilus nigrolimitatus]